MSVHQQSILEKTSDKSFTIGFFAIVTIELIAGYLFWSTTEGSGAFWTLGTILVFGGLLLLGIGYKLDGKKSHLITMIGWIVFAAYWAMQPMELYVIEGGDIVNMLFCVIGVYVLMYLAYQELGLYYTESENINLRWMAGATFIIGWVYFVIDKIPSIASALIYGVAQQTVWLLNLFGLPAYIGPGQTISNVVHGCNIYYNGVDFPITIVLACTGIQSMAIF
ncbi:MAG: archaeosortase A, partial [Candidatus Thermoplasmatota archaeon]|nr:archaeosortase A [Candidatus Thermoplasmatota archaeon]